MHHLTKNLTALAFIFALILFPASWALAGDLEPPSGPAPTMRSLQEIWNKLDVIDGKIEGGDASIPKTGQTTSYVDRDDGALQQGVAWPDPRFTDNGDGTVTDNLTNLVWLKNANCDGTKTWADALAFANALENGEKCGTADAVLTDGSAAGDWWLPNWNELRSLVDASQFNPALPSVHPFTGVQPSYYWSSTTVADNTFNAWYVAMYYGTVNLYSKAGPYLVWPVRAGQ